MYVLNLGKLIIFLALLLISSRVEAFQYTYDSLDRLTRIVYDSGAVIEYAYDPAGNITTVTNRSNPPTLTNAVHSLQVLTGQNPPGISTANDINEDGRIGLPEAIDVLKKLSQ